MKRFLSIFMCLVLVISASAVFTSCDSTDEPAATTTAETTATTTEEGTASSTTSTTTAATSATTTSTTASTSPAPAGCTLCVLDGIVFAYPEEWAVATSNGYTQITSPNQLSNIVVNPIEKTTLYDNLTAQQFTDIMSESLSNEGMTMSDVTANTVTSNGLSVNIYSYNATVAAYNVSMAQTLFVVTVGETTYSITLTEMTADADVANTIITTIRAK